MLMPAIAFTWWLMSQPIDTAQATAPRAFGDAAGVTHEWNAEPSRGPTTDLSADAPGAAMDNPETPADRVLYRGLITADIARVARSFLDLPMGSERFADVNGQHFVFVLQRHYHPPGFVGAPSGWHKGVTVYALR